MTADATAPAPTRSPAPERSSFPLFRPIGTRWMDNDVYGHVNNVVYYSFFDTAVNGYLIDAGALQIETSAVIGLVVETHCNYYAPLAYPQAVEAGLRVSQVGRSSVRYEVGLFAAGDSRCAAAGHFVHVYVDRQTRRPAALPEVLRAAVQSLRG